MKPDDSFAPFSGVAGRVARLFVDSKLTPLIVVTSVLLGLLAVNMLPREEEPQIKVPLIDVLVSMPGFSAKEVEERATRPMEKLLWEIPGVEYLYSTSRTGESRDGRLRSMNGMLATLCHRSKLPGDFILPSRSSRASL